MEVYGAFVNFGAEKDGLVHISQLSVSSGGTVDLNNEHMMNIASCSRSIQ